METINSKIKEKRWREAEDVAASSVNSEMKTSRRSSVPLHLDLASPDMAGAGQVGVGEAFERAGSRCLRLSLSGGFQAHQTDSDGRGRPRILERSHSDACLLRWVCICENKVCLNLFLIIWSSLSVSCMVLKRSKL